MMRTRLTTRPSLASLVAILFLAASARASTVTGIRVDFRDGQTFITWNNLAGTGWIYHVFSMGGAFVDGSSFDFATEVAQVGEETSVDQRISSLLGQTLTYRIAENEPPLDPTRGLFVVTPGTGGLNYYAVMAERIGTGEDLTVVPGENVTASPVLERVQRPRPVWQRTLQSPAGEDYVLWSTNTATPLFPAMCNLPGWAWHVGVIRGTPGAALVLGGHGRGGNFFNSFHGTGVPGEWVLSFDDYLPTGDVASFYFGYEQNYDLEDPFNLPRAEGGLVRDYTEQRVMYLLDWADREMPHDKNRVYAMGGSMGGSFGFFLAWHHPDRVAGALAIVPKLCLGYRPDAFLGLREALDRMWGSPDLDLPSTAGPRVFEWMDGREQARIEHHRGSAPVVGFCGINDSSVGWGEKVAYFQALEDYNAGGAWFWDERDHYTPPDQAMWGPMTTGQLLYKFRSDQSYPAFAHCSADDHPGDGDPATADPIGQINATADWDETSIMDDVLRWEITLRTRALTTLEGIIGAPAALAVDVTPRRLQRFIVARQATYQYEVRQVTDGALIQSGTATADEDAVLTIPQVRVVNAGVRLSAFPTSLAGVQPGASARHVPHLAMSRNPVQNRASLTIEWPGEGDGVVELFDPQGRRVRTEFRGSARGITERTFLAAGLAPGLYVLEARQGSARSTRRVTVIH